MPHPPFVGKVKGRSSHAAGIDDSEGECCHDQNPFYDETEEGEWAEGVSSEVERNLEGTVNDSSVKRIRLRVKTDASPATGYPARELLKLNEYRIRQYQRKLAKKKQETEYRIARSNAIELLSRQAPIGTFALDERIDTGPIEHPDPSHRIVALHGQSDIIFCKRCGWWSARATLR